MIGDGQEEIKHKGVVIDINQSRPSLIMLSHLVHSIPCGEHLIQPASRHGSQGYYPWQPTETWHWKPYPGVQPDAWGCRVMPIPQGNYSTFTQNMQNANGFHLSSTMDKSSGMPQRSSEEVIDEVMKEAINKPWLPLPLGLKPPSTDSVLAELSRQGISTILLTSTALLPDDVALDYSVPPLCC
ncbi:two-component response regulator-like APRR2 [Hibiscus syriacus]|uniref:two-component response regulator-like APRR2 n=1 Tax=Hibiscus syriacus TaxID=106335 RepID=UPI001922A503|nr:two-component response regulator-like APRR2 [Hibiscus syriacus]